MKKVAVVYKNFNNPNLVSYLEKSLKNIFKNYITVENYFMNKLGEDTIIDADTYLLTEETILYKLKNHIKDCNSIVFMGRNLNKTHIDEVLKIPPNTDVLVVNDTYESAVKLLCSLIQLGASHLNLIPLDLDDIDNPIYRDCQVCITTNEVFLVPDYIKETINMGYRKISFDTLIRLMHKLELNFDLINRNLIQYVNNVAEPNISIYKDYLNSFVKSHALRNLTNSFNTAILITDKKYNLIFLNDNANSWFNKNNTNHLLGLSDIMDKKILVALQEDDIVQTNLSIDKIKYSVEKKPIMLLDKIMGYSITFQGTPKFTSKKTDINKQLKKKGLYAKYSFEDIIHNSPEMKECISTAKTVALTDNTVLITGDSGTGKELIAQSMHNYSGRKNKPFVALNCAALPESLLESELFGYEKGSFTGANKDGKLGLFELANGGTIFLDEIGDISHSLQIRLLRALQEHEIIRLGSERVIKIDTRIIAATNKDLEKEVGKGNFRKDLYYRLNVITLFIEPLKNRKEDILPLIANFLGTKYQQLSSLDKELLNAYSWPGNIRELRNTAIHYKTLGKLPNYITEEFHKPAGVSPFDPNKVDVEMEILKIITENTQPYHGIGRVQINSMLRAMGINIGDSNLRNILYDLQEDGLINIGRGRSGTQVTELGIKMVQNTAI